MKRYQQMLIRYKTKYRMYMRNLVTGNSYGLKVAAKTLSKRIPERTKMWIKENLEIQRNLQTETS